MNHSNPVQKVIAAHDLSGCGRCALTAIIPTLAAMGVQPIPLPTAVLSTQTDGYDHFTFHDLSNELEPICRHWESLGKDFEAIYTGFLAGDEQAKLLYRLMKPYKGKTILVDPVLGDDGSLYPVCTPPLQASMKNLVTLATVTTPNLTEAALLLDKECPPAYDKTEIDSMLYAIADLGPRQVVITGIPKDNCIVTAYLDTLTGKSDIFTQAKIPKRFPGTGDIFSSVLLGCLLNSTPLSDAVAFAATFIGDVIAFSAQFDYPRREGVLLEPLLYKLTDWRKNNVR